MPKFNDLVRRETVEDPGVVYGQAADVLRPMAALFAGHPAQEMILKFAAELQATGDAYDKEHGIPA
jgi:hypothetical protein